jgi:hypothetical protein
VKTLKIVAAALTAAALLGEEGCTNPQTRTSVTTRSTAAPNSSSHGAFIGGGGAGAVGAAGAMQNRDAAGKARGGSNADGEGSHGGGFGEAGGAHGSGG